MGKTRETLKWCEEMKKKVNTPVKDDPNTMSFICPDCLWQKSVGQFAEKETGKKKECSAIAVKGRSP